jgi:hypothetical protein
MTSLDDHTTNVHSTLRYISIQFDSVSISNASVQASEQLNAWIGGFESILSKITGGNFNWFLHTMLFMHTLFVIQKQKEKERKNADEEEGEEEEVGIDIDEEM